MSGPSSSLRADARRNRQAILAAADQAFAEEGLGVPVDDIARRAGVGAGTLYRHFPTKEALFEAVLVQHMEDLAEAARALADRDPPAEALFEFMARLARAAATKRNLMQALAGAGIDVKEAAGEQKAAVERGFQLLLERAQAAGQIRADVTTGDLFNLVMGSCVLAQPQADDLCQARMLDVVCAGLKAEAAAPR